MFSASETVKKTEVKEETATVDIKTEKETPKKQSPKKKEVSEWTNRVRVTSSRQTQTEWTVSGHQNSKNDIGKGVHLVIFPKVIGSKYSIQKRRTA